MNKNDSEKTEKNKHTIEITIPINGVISGDNKSSITSNTDMNRNSKDPASKKGQMNDQSDESNSSDDSTSKDGEMSTQSDQSDSDDTNSKTKKVIINITN